MVPSTSIIPAEAACQSFHLVLVLVLNAALLNVPMIRKEACHAVRVVHIRYFGSEKADAQWLPDGHGRIRQLLASLLLLVGWFFAAGESSIGFLHHIPSSAA